VLIFEIAPTMQSTRPAERWLTAFATTAVGLLRACDAQLDTGDFLATGL
jgi:hypothetical protein